MIHFQGDSDRLVAPVQLPGRSPEIHDSGEGSGRKGARFTRPNPRGMGWIRDIPSIRDYGPFHEHVSLTKMQLGQNESIREMLEKTDALDAGVDLPSRIDLREWFPPVDDQGPLGSSAVHAVIGLVAYFEYRAWGRHVDLSSRFLYKTARKLMQVEGDTGRIRGAFSMPW